MTAAFLVPCLVPDPSDLTTVLTLCLKTLGRNMLSMWCRPPSIRIRWFYLRVAPGTGNLYARMADDIRLWANGSNPCSRLIICRQMAIVLLLDATEVPN